MCLAMGTSLCGMTADCVATTVGQRAVAAHPDTEAGSASAPANGTPLGLVIVNLQRTQHDAMAALRIYATTDAFMRLVAKRMRLRLGKDTLPQSRWRKA